MEAPVRSQLRLPSDINEMINEESSRTRLSKNRIIVERLRASFGGYIFLPTSEVTVTISNQKSRPEGGHAATPHAAPQDQPTQEDAQ